MSQSLYWAPRRNGVWLPDELKYIIRKRYECLYEPVTLSAGDRDYLQGLADAGIPGAKDLLEALDANDTIDIWTA